MSDIPRRTIIRSIKRKGFSLHPKKTHHDWYFFYYNGKWYKQIAVKVSRGSSYKTYSQELWKRMKKLLQLDSNEELRELLECPMDYASYLAILKDKKLI